MKDKSLTEPQVVFAITVECGKPNRESRYFIPVRRNQSRKVETQNIEFQLLRDSDEASIFEVSLSYF